MNKQGMKGMLRSNPKGEGCYFCWCFYFSDLPCMHLDPGVNRLGLNITSVHQTDRRPVTPDIVFPICVILWPQEDGLKKTQQNKKRSIHFTNTLTHTCIQDQRSQCQLVPCLQDSLERSQSDFKTANQNMQMKEGESSFNSQAAFKAGRTPLGSTGGRLRRQLWSYARRPVRSEDKHHCLL